MGESRPYSTLGVGIIVTEPSAIRGVGSGWSMVVRVWLTAGLITSECGFGIHTQNEQQRDQWCYDDEFARHQVTQPVVAHGDRTGHHPLVHPQDVDRREHQCAGREHRERRIAGERADQHQEFADERREPGQGQRRQAGDQERAGKHQGDLLHAAVGVNQASSPARHQESGDEEQRRRRDAVVDHVQRRAGLAWLVITKMPRMMNPKCEIEV